MTQPLTPIDLHVLLVLSREPLYGYAIMKAVEEESDGGLAPEIGSLYRVLGRLVGEGWVEQIPRPAGSVDDVHPGRPRKYYALTSEGRGVLRVEVARLRGVLDLAIDRDLLPRRS